METLVKADLFFTITSAAVILIAAAAVLAMVYVILILNELRRLMRHIRQEGENIVNDLSRIRQAIENQGWRTKEMVDFLGSGAVSLFRLFQFGRRNGGSSTDSHRE